MDLKPRTPPANLSALYGQSLVEYQFDGDAIFVISDLHMGGGLQPDGNYTGCENFFADHAFARFMNRLAAHPGNQKLLVINGDLIDFLRISDIPETPEAILQWQQFLNAVGINKSTDELSKSISPKERKYGLKTDDYKSVWKLRVCVQGHPLFFASLAHWLLAGHRLVITKGNHDLEWYWPAVRACMKQVLAEKMATISSGSTESILQDLVRPNLLFVDDRLIINGKLYIEHGHRYEHFTSVDGPPVLENQTELNLPFGSFFNRYLINRIELAYPYIDNVRPRTNILPVLIRERFPLALKIVLNYVPFALLVIPKRQYAYALRYLFHFLWLIGLPVALVVAAFVIHPVKINFCTSTGVLGMLFTTLENLALLALSYFLGRLFAMLKLSSPDSLYQNAEQAMVTNPNVSIVTFGHTHNPEQRISSKGRRYYNTGTWIPVFETSAADIRPDRTYTFLWLTKDAQNIFSTANLVRWNDDAERTEALILMDRS